MAEVYGFNEKDVKRVGDAVKKVEKLTQDQQLLTRRHKKRSTGGGGYTYIGYFKLNIDGASVTVHDNNESSSYASATNAGLAQINNSLFTVLKDSVATTGDGFIFLQATVSSGVIQTPTLQFSTTWTYADNVFKLLLGRCNYSGGSLASVTQEHHGLAYGWLYTATI